MHLRTSLQYIRRSPFQAMAAISVLAITFFITTFLSVILYSSEQALTYFETRPQIIAFVKEDVNETSITEVQVALESDPRIKDLTYVSKDQALEIYKEATADNPLLAELVNPSIFPASLEFSVTDLEYANEVVDEISQLEIIESVGFTASLGGQESLSDVVNRLRSITRYVRIGGASLTGVLATSSFLVLLVVVGLRISSRRREIETLEMIGATGGFIRTPFVFEAIIYAIVGVLSGWLVALLILLYSTPSVISYFGEIPVLPPDTSSFFMLLSAILAAELVIGLFIALGGSLLAISRARK